MDISQLGASGAVVIVVIIFLKYMREDSKKRDNTYNRVAKALNTVSHSSQNADKRSEARHRELVEAVGKIPDMINETATLTAKVLKRTPVDQKIKKQEVAQQIIKNGN